MQFIDLQSQYRRYQAEIDARIRRVLEHGQFILGPEIAELEDALGHYVGVKHCLTVASGDAVAEALKAAGVPTGVYYPKCLHEQPVFAGLGYRAGDFPEAERAAREVLSLPMHPFLTDPDQARVIETVRRAVRSEE